MHSLQYIAAVSADKNELSLLLWNYPTIRQYLLDEVDQFDTDYKNLLNYWNTWKQDIHYDFNNVKKAYDKNGVMSALEEIKSINDKNEQFILEYPLYKCALQKYKKYFDFKLGLNIYEWQNELSKNKADLNMEGNIQFEMTDDISFLIMDVKYVVDNNLERIKITDCNGEYHSNNIIRVIKQKAVVIDYYQRNEGEELGLTGGKLCAYSLIVELLEHVYNDYKIVF